MTELVETIENIPKTQKDMELIVNKRSYESYRSQFQLDQTASKQRKKIEEATKILWETIEDMDKEIEFKDNTIKLSIDNI